MKEATKAFPLKSRRGKAATVITSVYPRPQYIVVRQEKERKDKRTGRKVTKLLLLCR